MQKLATIHVSIRGIFRKDKEDMMQSRLWISAVLLLSSISVQTAAAGPQEDVAAAGQKWAAVFAENNPDAMLPLYAKDAVLWGTLSPTVRSDPAALKAYFVGAFQALPKATVKFGDQLIRTRRRNQIDPGPLQLHVCEGRQRLENRRSPFVRSAGTA
jgi:hypothetical protein